MVVDQVLVMDVAGKRLIEICLIRVVHAVFENAADRNVKFLRVKLVDDVDQNPFRATDNQ